MDPNKKEEVLLVVSYNILAARYDRHADIDGKPQRLCKDLERFISSEAIICLQEISSIWVRKFRLLFGERNYTFVSKTYNSGAFGVAIAIPNKYELSDFDTFLISDGKSWPEKLEDYNGEWRMCSELSNVVVVGAVKLCGVKIVIANFHMPCKFLMKTVIPTYLFLCVKIVEDFAKKNNTKEIIIAADFNIRPDTELYDSLISGKPCDNILSYYDSLWPSGDCWRPDKFGPYISSFSHVNGSEPEFTNFSYTNNSEEPFRDCIDYVIYKGDKISPTYASIVRKNEDTGKIPYPYNDEESDHVPLYVAFTTN